MWYLNAFKAMAGAECALQVAFLTGISLTVTFLEF